MSRRIDEIILHCSASSMKGQNAALIDKWHRARGFTRIGYHYFIGFDGKLEAGRYEDEVGAHARGHNAHSIGICLAGLEVEDFTPAQFQTLRSLLRDLKLDHPKARLLGHYEVDQHGKTCPVFDLGPWKEFWNEKN